MAKSLKISYKIYHNDRLKETSFHGKQLLPLYIQVVYNRNNIQFRSYYFDLFSKEKYALATTGKNMPRIKDIFKLETDLIEYIINKLGDTFSLELFRKTYHLYSIDLCDYMELAFREHISIFFKQEGMAELGFIINEGGRQRMMYRVIEELKQISDKKFYQKLKEHAFCYEVPYLPLFQFMETKKIWPMLILSVREWETEETRGQFVKFIGKAYSATEAEEMKTQIDRWVKALKTVTFV